MKRAIWELRTGAASSLRAKDEQLPGKTIALVGAHHPGAARLALALEDEPAAERVLGLGRAAAPLLGPKFEHVMADAGDERFAAALGEADVLVVFPLIEVGDRDGRATRERLAAAIRGALEGARRADTLVLWSSGVAYGAHPDNPVPLTEDSPARPNFDFPPARALVEAERLVLDPAIGNPQARRVVLRAAAIWAPAWGGFLARMLLGPALVGVRGYDPAVQSLDPDDAAAALALAATGRLDGGVYNVAPDDWVPASQLPRLTGRRRVEIPEPAAFAAADRLAWLGVAGASPGELHYHMHPWVLSNSRLRAAGWAPGRSSAAALRAIGETMPEGVRLGRLHVKRGDVVRGAAAGLALVAALAVVARRAIRGGRP
jgi:UDP-glucose 4-epimerase